MLIHEQIPNLTVEDNVSETDADDWENLINFDHLTDHTLQSKMRQLIEQKQLLPLINKILTMVSSLRDQYFYEVEIQNQNLLITMATEGDEAAGADCEFMLVNQSIPLVYRYTIQNVLNELYGEEEYEFNEVLLLKKVAALFVTLATNKEPEKEEELIKVCEDWHNNQLVYEPRDKELKLLLD